MLKGGLDGRPGVDGGSGCDVGVGIGENVLFAGGDNIGGRPGPGP
jgi:hypothetical protein